MDNVFEDEDELSFDVAEDDLASDVRPDSTVTWSADWTVTTIIEQLRRKRFDLEPAFQRRDVWSPSKRSKFIESLLLGIPVPQVILAERRDSRGNFIVLDGKQRLRTLQRFAGLDGDGMRLTGLDVHKHLNGVTYERLMQNPEWDHHLAALENAAIRAVVLRGWRNESLLYMTFLRLNSNVVGLSPQELRRALHPGPFMDFLMERSSESSAIREFLGIRSADFRMRDAELLLRHLALTLHIDQYRGNLRAFLDQTCEVENEEWSTNSRNIEYHTRGLEDAIFFTQSIFGAKDAFRRFTGRAFETRRNRSVLDVMTYYFQHPEVRAEAEDSQSQVVNLFKETCRDDSNFSDFLTSTTKSVPAVFGRLSIWGTALSRLAPSASKYIPG